MYSGNYRLAMGAGRIEWLLIREDGDVRNAIRMTHRLNDVFWRLYHGEAVLKVL